MTLSVSEVRKINDSLEMIDEDLSDMSILNELDMMGDEEGDEDLGAETNLDGAVDSEEQDEEQDDIVDDFLSTVIDMLEVEYEPDSAMNAVEDAISSLADEGSIEYPPASDVSNEEKARWIWNSIAKIRERLHDFGLEFDEADLAHYNIVKDVV